MSSWRAREFRGGLDEKMRRMWLGIEIFAADLPPQLLDRQSGIYVEYIAPENSITERGGLNFVEFCEINFTII